MSRQPNPTEIDSIDDEIQQRQNKKFEFLAKAFCELTLLIIEKQCELCKKELLRDYLHARDCASVEAISVEEEANLKTRTIISGALRSFISKKP